MFNDEYRHTSLIATLRKVWNLGAAITQRDAHARTFDDLFTLDTPRDPATWAPVNAHPEPAYQLDETALAKGLSVLGEAVGRAYLDLARDRELPLPPHLADPDAVPTGADFLEVIRQLARRDFPLLNPDTPARA